MKTNRYLLIALCAILISFFACKKNDADTNNSANNPGNSQDSNSGLNESLMLQLVNQKRSEGCNCGTAYFPPVKALTWNNQLELAAFNHAADMDKNKFFSHTGSNGSSAGDRITLAGYNWSTYGENIAYNYSTEQAVVEGWIKSEGHCKNIMDPDYKELGAAKVAVYWVQNFAAK